MGKPLPVAVVEPDVGDVRNLESVRLFLAERRAHVIAVGDTSGGHLDVYGGCPACRLNRESAKQRRNRGGA